MSEKLDVKLLSIIIPTYNMEALLARCLDSLLAINSEEQLAALEVLVVNDGSKDRSLEIATAYAQKYTSSVRVIDKVNGNYGSCINAGMSLATGKYVRILDADDWYDTDALAQLLDQLKKSDADLLLTDYSRVFAEGKKLRFGYEIPPSQLLDATILSDPNFYTKAMMHAFTFKRELFELMGSYKQTEGISYTDQEWIFYPLEYVKTVVYFPLDVYQYFIGREGQTMDPEVERKKVGDKVLITRRMLTYFCRFESEQSPFRRYIEYRLERMIMQVYKTYLLLDRDDSRLGQLSVFDSFVKQESPYFYARSNAFKIHNFLPLRYISRFRVSGSRYPNAILWLNGVMKNIQNKLK